MATHHERLTAAREAVRFICSRDSEQMSRPVPNCPGWTVYNAAVHIGRVGIAWRSMIDASPDDPESRTRGYAAAEEHGPDQPAEVLASWCIDAIDALDDDVGRACYFSMTGGAGTVGLWGWHAASELAVHRLDVEAALGMPHELSDPMAVDALDYAIQFFLPAMARATGSAPGSVDVIARRDGVDLAHLRVESSDAVTEPSTAMTGLPIDLLLALWGRPHGPLTVTGSEEVASQWMALPSSAFQFGTWD